MPRKDHLISVPTRGRTLDLAALVYDFFEPILLMGKISQYYQKIIPLLDLLPGHRILDLGCGTGVP